ncbi:hypothetical protein GJ496_007327 [Pomphorhynchus laevis]|nr:hypothetical protein GJ496_007327 [Pomphorhynchus laevis]
MSEQPANKDRIQCHVCSTINRRKQLVQCSDYRSMFHLSCVDLTKRQASAIPIWRCSKCLHNPTFSDCRSTVTPVFPDNKTTTLLDYIAMCRRSHKVLSRIPKGAIVFVAQSLDCLLMDTINLKHEVSWTRLLCFCYWVLRRPNRSCVNRESVKLAIKVKRQTVYLMISRTIIPIPSELPANKTLEHITPSEIRIGNVSL